MQQNQDELSELERLRKLRDYVIAQEDNEDADLDEIIWRAKSTLTSPLSNEAKT